MDSQVTICVLHAGHRPIIDMHLPPDAWLQPFLRDERQFLIVELWPSRKSRQRCCEVPLQKGTKLCTSISQRHCYRDCDV